MAADELLGLERRHEGLRRRSRIERADGVVADWRNEDRFAASQSRVDSVASLWDQKAGRPIAGESLGTFKRRSVRHWQSLSPIYKDADFRVLQVADGVAFNVAVDDILKCADEEGRRPTRVPQGYLAQRVTTKGGHTETRFYGRPVVVDECIRAAWAGGEAYQPHGQCWQRDRRAVPAR